MPQISESLFSLTKIIDEGATFDRELVFLNLI